MKKCLLIILMCMFLCGCDDKISIEQYNELEKKHNALQDKYDTEKETDYLDEYLSSDYNVQASKMGKYDILEFYIDVSEGSDYGVVGIIDLMHEDWFDYDYILMYGYSDGYIVGITQFDVRTGKTISTFERSND